MACELWDQLGLGEFWGNHFTTDYDKLVEYLEDLDAYRALEGMTPNLDAQIRFEAATMQFQEYEFYYQNALGNFGDLLMA